MMRTKEFSIDLKEDFTHLPSAPIEEAVIHWRARPEAIQDPADFYKELKRRLEGYPTSQPQHEIELQAKGNSEGMAMTVNRPNWSGYRFTSEDEHHIAQFMRNGFAFSRLKPYQNWSCFESEALRLWQIYLDLANPTELQRLDVRFINSIHFTSMDEVEELLTAPPKSPSRMNVPLTSFTHQSIFAIPETLYNLNIVQTVQPTNALKSEVAHFILDLDVFTDQVPEIDEDSLKGHLSKMRWIKNKAFFSSLTPKAIERFKEK
jgi:uncharacterized protein (TIGR04255 family)